MTAELICPRTGLTRVAEQMYRALKSKPCGCGMRRDFNDKLVWAECGGCVAKAAYEAITEASR